MEQNDAAAPNTGASSATSSAPTTTTASLTRVTSNESSSSDTSLSIRHPLSPSIEDDTSRRPSISSYFPDPSLLTGDGNVSDSLFKDTDDSPEILLRATGNGESASDEMGHQRYEELAQEIRTPRGGSAELGLAASPSLHISSSAGKSTATWVPTTIRLPRAPHLISAVELRRRLDEQNSDAMALALVQELSSQLTDALEELAASQAKQAVRETALLQILKDNTPAGHVTDGMIDRALLRASAEATEKAAREAGSKKQTSWKAVVRLPKATSPPRRRKGRVC